VFNIHLFIKSILESFLKIRRCGGEIDTRFFHGIVIVMIVIRRSPEERYMPPAFVKEYRHGVEIQEPKRREGIKNPSVMDPLEQMGKGQSPSVPHHFGRIMICGIRDRRQLITDLGRIIESFGKIFHFFLKIQELLFLDKPGTAGRPDLKLERGFGGAQNG